MLNTSFAKFISVLFLGLGLAAAAQAQDRSITDFRLGVVALKAGNGTDPLSVDVHWTPSISHQDLTIRADIGLSLVAPDGVDQFAIFGYELFIEQLVEGALHVEGGGGFQNWLEHGGTTPVASAHLVWEMDKDSRLLKVLYAGLSKSFGEQSAWLGRVGMGLRL